MQAGAYPEKCGDERHEALRGNAEKNPLRAVPIGMAHTPDCAGTVG